jgi:Mg2+/Co2+ transporter CorB
MSRKATAIWIMVVVVLMTVMPNAYAHAYLDPGSGSLIIQLLVAALLGIAVTARVFWGNILSLLRIKQPTADDDDGDDDIE